MCALFGSGVNVHRVATDRFDVHVVPGPLLEAPPVHRADLLKAISTAFPLTPPAVVSQPVDEGLLQAQSQPLSLAFGVTSRKETPQPVRVGSHDFGSMKLVTRTHDVPEMPRPRLHKGLSTVRDLPVLKRMTPAKILTPTQVSHWQQRLGNSKRVNPRQVNLVGVFPNVALEGEQPVQFKAQEGAIAYHLPDRPVPLSTVVVAKHAVTGEVLIGRFHAES